MTPTGVNKLLSSWIRQNSSSLRPVSELLTYLAFRSFQPGIGSVVFEQEWLAVKLAVRFPEGSKQKREIMAHLHD